MLGCKKSPTVPEPSDNKQYEGKIVFNTKRDGGYDQIYIMNGDGSNQINLTNNGSHNISPVFSPDGSKIAFESFRDGNCEIYIMDIDGSNQTNLTNNESWDDSPVFQPT
jgi:TolB protein